MQKFYLYIFINLKVKNLRNINCNINIAIQDTSKIFKNKKWNLYLSLRSFDTVYNIDDGIIYKLVWMHDSDMHPHYHLMHSLCFKPG